MSKEVTFSHPYTQLLIAARAASIPVIYVTVAFRPGYPEISPGNQIFAAVKQRQSSSSAPMTTMEILLKVNYLGPPLATISAGF